MNIPKVKLYVLSDFYRVNRKIVAINNKPYNNKNTAANLKFGKSVDSSRHTVNKNMKEHTPFETKSNVCSLQKLYFQLAVSAIIFCCSGFANAEASSLSNQKPSYIKFDIETHLTPWAETQGENILKSNTFFSASSGYPITRKHIFILSATFGISKYDWQDFTWNPSQGEPQFSLAHSAALKPGLIWKLNDKNTLLVLNQFQTAEARDSKFSDTLSYSGSLILSHKISESFKVTALLMAQYKLDDKWHILPVPAFTWQATPSFKIELSGGASGPFLRGSLKARSKTQIFAEGRFETFEYQTLDHNNDKAIFKDRSWTALAGFQYQQTRTWYWEFSTGLQFARSLSLDPQTDAKISISPSASPQMLFKTHFEF